VTGEEAEGDAIPAVIDLKKAGNVFIRQVFDDYGKMTIPPLRREERSGVLFRKYHAPSSMG
jgi:hypothetical protein